MRLFVLEKFFQPFSGIRLGFRPVHTDYFQCIILGGALLIDDAVQHQVGDLGALVGHCDPDEMIHGAGPRQVHGAGHGGRNIVTAVALSVVVHVGVRGKDGVRTVRQHGFDLGKDAGILLEILQPFARLVHASYRTSSVHRGWLPGPP